MALTESARQNTIRRSTSQAWILQWEVTVIRIDRPGDLAHRIDRIPGESRDARARSVDREIGRLGLCARNLAQDCNLRQVGSHIVMQIGRKATSIRQ